MRRNKARLIRLIFLERRITWEEMDKVEDEDVYTQCAVQHHSGRDRSLLSSCRAECDD
jgi:hypothetical protein